jgi:hypothetical protein
MTAHTPAPGPATNHSADHRDGVIAQWEFRKNRAGQSIKIQLKRFRGVVLVDLFIWVPADGGYRKREGFAATVNHLPALAATLRNAEAKARELGLIESEAAQ